MKPFLFLLVCLGIGALAFGQGAGARTYGSDNEDHIKIVVAKDSMRVSFKDKSFRINAIKDLDSCMRLNIGGLTQPVVDIETYGDITPQDHRAIIVITDKYRCPVVSEKQFSDGKQRGAVMKMARFDNNGNSN